MAEVDQVLAKFSDKVNGGVLQFIAVCETTQTELDAEGSPSPLVVRISIRNTTTKRGLGVWQHSNGQIVEATVLQNEDMPPASIAPPRRVGVHRLIWSLSRMP